MGNCLSKYKVFQYRDTDFLSDLNLLKNNEKCKFYYYKTKIDEVKFDDDHVNIWFENVEIVNFPKDECNLIFSFNIANNNKFKENLFKYKQIVINKINSNDFQDLIPYFPNLNQVKKINYNELIYYMNKQEYDKKIQNLSLENRANYEINKHLYEFSSYKSQNYDPITFNYFMPDKLNLYKLCKCIVYKFKKSNLFVKTDIKFCNNEIISSLYDNILLINLKKKIIEKKKVILMILFYFFLLILIKIN